MDALEFWALTELQKDAHLQLDLAMERLILLQTNLLISIENEITGENKALVEPFVEIPPSVARLRNYKLN